MTTMVTMIGIDVILTVNAFCRIGSMEGVAILALEQPHRSMTCLK